MKITYIGLSCFLLENEKGYKILVDPFNDDPSWSLGPRFPKEIDGKPFGTNVVLMTEPDADHAYAPGDWLANAPQTKPNSNPFPGLDVRGVIVYEYNGDLNMAWAYTIDGIRCVHLGDNAHVLTQEQLEEIGQIDIAFMSQSKLLPEKEGAFDVTRKNIAALNPRMVIWAHHLAPADLPKDAPSEELRKYFRGYFEKNAVTNRGYKDPESFMNLCYLYENNRLLNPEYQGVDLDVPTFEITKEELEKHTSPKGLHFRAMIAKP
jgi:L-ascorbate metabolism protein UlaG (beta-lactamase superfamily)